MNLDIEMLQITLGQMALEILALKTQIKRLENERLPKTNGAEHIGEPAQSLQ